MTYFGASVSDLRKNEVLISYSRKDKEFVQTLDAALRRLDRDPWIDWEDIQPTEDWWKAIETGIEAAGTFVFIISPDSVISKVCNQEINHAVKHNKRIVPIVRRDCFDMDGVHPALAKHNWLFFREQDDFDRALAALIEAIDTDLTYVRTHTRLLVRAKEWESKGYDKSFLLRGSDLEAAEQWRAQTVEDKKPSPTELHTQYILASRKAETARSSVTLGAVTFGFIVAAVLAIIAFIQYQKAELSLKAAIRSQLFSISASSEALFKSNRELEALTQIIEAGELLRQVNDVEEDTKIRVVTALEEIVYKIRERNRLLGHDDWITSVSFSQKGEIASASLDKTIKLWRGDGKLLKTLKGHTDGVLSVSFSLDGEFGIFLKL